MKRFGLLFLLVVFCGGESQAQAQKSGSGAADGDSRGNVD